MYRAVLEHVSDAERVAQMDVNYLAPMDLIRLVLPRMREKHAGRILNVSSVGGMMAMPTMAVYSASKFALEGATEALYYEVRPWNIRVSLIQPGLHPQLGLQKRPLHGRLEPGPRRRPRRVPRPLRAHGRRSSRA